MALCSKHALTPYLFFNGVPYPDLPSNGSFSLTLLSGFDLSACFNTCCVEVSKLEEKTQFDTMLVNNNKNKM